MGQAVTAAAAAGSKTVQTKQETARQHKQLDKQEKTKHIQTNKKQT